MELFDAIRRRRSISRLSDPAPSPDELERMLEAAVLAPDHKVLRPWRFVVLRGDAKTAFREVLVEALVRREPEASEGQIQKERSKLDRAPLVIAVATKAVETKLPFVELLGATHAAVQNLLLAATALGYGSVWRTGVIVCDPHIKGALDLSAADELVGFVYLGTNSGETPPERQAVLEGVVSEWEPPTTD